MKVGEKKTLQPRLRSLAAKTNHQLSACICYETYCILPLNLNIGNFGRHTTDDVCVPFLV